jgi:nitronate monooxygenase
MTDLLARLGLDHPIIQAPMAGGTTTPALVAAASAAGVLGSFGSAYETADVIRRNAATVRAATARAFAINLFLDEGRMASPFELQRTRALLAPMRRRFAMNEEAEPVMPPRLADQIAAVMDTAPAVFSSTFGAPEAAVVRDAKVRGMAVIGTATSPLEAEILLTRGVDAIVAQGSEAGGHRGTFAHTLEEGLIGVLPLTSLIVAMAGAVPVIAAGGLMTGAGVAAVLRAGATAAQLGTAFIACPESGAPAAYRAALLSDRARTTTLTRAFSGRWARGLPNAYTQATAAVQHELAPYPALNGMTADLRRAAAAAGDAEYMSLWAGQGAALTRALPVSELIAALVAEMREAG